ncbi:SDR family oxidoreductase [bacterium]|nr:SDR family oxidoreductase [bacterium]
MEFDQKVVLVTGASSGIGQAAAFKFANEGANVAAVARRIEKLQNLREQSQNIYPFAADLTREDQTSAVVKSIIDKLGRIDVVIHAAGIIGTGSIENVSLSDWDVMMNINLRSILQLTQLCLPELIKNKGNIVCVSSVAGLRSFPGILAYSVSKAALDQFTRCTALELASKGVRVNAVNPGVVVTHLHRSGGMNEEQYQAFLERSTTTHPLGRAGTAEEIADLILFLASSRASWITGITCSIDGGRALTCAR